MCCLVRVAYHIWGAGQNLSLYIILNFSGMSIHLPSFIDYFGVHLMPGIPFINGCHSGRDHILSYDSESDH